MGQVPAALPRREDLGFRPDLLYDDDRHVCARLLLAHHPARRHGLLRRGEPVSCCAAVRGRGVPHVRERLVWRQVQDTRGAACFQHNTCAHWSAIAGVLKESRGAILWHILGHHGIKCERPYESDIPVRLQPSVRLKLD
jgi:hypothetical protein